MGRKLSSMRWWVNAGEDAYFVSSYGQGAFGVADGVGGWNTEGVDPSRYSRCSSCTDTLVVSSFLFLARSSLCLGAPCAFYFTAPPAHISIHKPGGVTSRTSTAIISNISVVLSR